MIGKPNTKKNHFFPLKFPTGKCLVGIRGDILIESVKKEKTIVFHTKKKLGSFPIIGENLFPTMCFPRELVRWEMGGKNHVYSTNFLLIRDEKSLCF